jgi:hypothetical protein
MSDYWYPTNLFSAAKMTICKKQCENDPRFMYTGKEVSPLGLGFAPHGYDVGTLMKGRDETSWMVAKKNDVNVWVRVPSELSIKSDLSKETPAMPTIDANPVPEPDEPVAKPAPKKKAAPKKKVVAKEVDDAIEQLPEPPKEVEEKEKPAPKKKAPAKKKKEGDDSAPVAPVAKKAAAADDKPKKVTDYQLYIKLAHANAKTDAEVQAMPSNERFKFVSSRAAADWKKMTAEEKTASVASMK